jgi:midasin (ATPase involved in ribosome maturation)
MHTIKGQDANKNVIELCIKQNLPILLVGDTGTGKTTIIQELAKKHKKKLSRANLHGQTSTDEFVGKMLLNGKSTYWQDGILITAMKEGHWILCDEINAALPEILFVLHSLLDDDKSVTLLENKGEVIKPHKDFRFFATMNPFDEYAGTKDLNKAFLSRFAIVAHFQYPDIEMEAEILRERIKDLTDDDSRFMVDLAERIREAKSKDEIYYTCSTRDLLFWGTFIKDLGRKTAFAYTILNKANAEDRKRLEELYVNVAQDHKSTASIPQPDSFPKVPSRLGLSKQEIESVMREGREKNLSFSEIRDKLDEMERQKKLSRESFSSVMDDSSYAMGTWGEGTVEEEELLS